MQIKRLAFLVTLTIVLWSLPRPANAQQQPYEPSVGQEGKDVIWVPTPAELVTALLDLAKVSPDDYVMDLGSGDGRFVIAAAKRGARALGVEYNPDMVELAKANALKEGVSDRARFIRGDIFETDFSQANVLTLYLLPNLNLRLRPKILEMKPGTRVVSNSFSMEDWNADDRVEVENRTGYLWIVPANVAGTWTCQTTSGEAELTLTQTFQNLQGNLKSGTKEYPIQEARMRGDEIFFKVAEGNPASWAYSGRVRGNTMEGLARTAGGSDVKWSARKRTAPKVE